MQRFYLMLIALLLCNSMFGQSTSNRKQLSLSQAYSMCLSSQPEIKSALLSQKAADLQFAGWLFPGNTEIEMGYDFIPSGSSISRANEKAYSLTQDLWNPYEMISNQSSMQSALRRARINYKHEELLLKGRIKSAYLKVQGTLRQVVIAGEHSSILKEFTEKADLRYTSGETNMLELLTARAAYSEVLNLYKNLKAQSDVAYYELMVLIGAESYSPGAYVLTDSLHFPGDTVSVLDQSGAETTPLEQLNELSIQDAIITEQTQWLQLLPALRTGYALRSRDGSNSFYGVSLGITLPLKSIFTYGSKMENAGIQRRIAEEKALLLKREQLVQKQKIFTGLMNDARQVNYYLSSLLPQAEEVYKVGKESYELGEASYLEYLQSKQIFINTQMEFSRILLSYNLALTEYETITGTIGE